MEDEFGPRLCEEALASSIEVEVVVAAPRDNDVGTVSLEPFHEMRAEKALAARDQDACHRATVVLAARSPVL